jgi:hypothetical protein
MQNDKALRVRLIAFKDLAGYREYWEGVLNNGDPLNHASAELMLAAVESAESLEQAESVIQEAIKVANERVLLTWKCAFSRED